MRALVLGFTVSEKMMNEVVDIDPNLSLQTYRFAWSLTSALKKANLSVSLVSAVPVTNYPGTKKLFFKGREFSQFQTIGVSISFVNLIFLKHITRLFSSLSQLIFLRAGEKIDYVFVHGIHSPFLISGVLMRLMGAKVIVVLTDPPNVVYSTDGFLSRITKRMDGALIGLLLSKFDGAICLSSYIAKDMLKKVPSVVIPGFFNESLLTYRKPQNRAGAEKSLVVAYAGALDQRYGISTLAEAVQRIKEFRVELHLYGKGDVVPHLNSHAFGNRVIYKGVLPPEQLYKELLNVDLIINPRPNIESYTKYSFPSKIIETLALGIPLMSTNLDGIPKEFFDHIWPIENCGVEELCEAISNFNRSSVSDRNLKAASGREFVKKNFSEEVQGVKILQFLLEQLS